VKWCPSFDTYPGPRGEFSVLKGPWNIGNVQPERGARVPLNSVVCSGPLKVVIETMGSPRDKKAITRAKCITVA
jgi:hypothetical protein